MLLPQRLICSTAGIVVSFLMLAKHTQAVEVARQPAGPTCIFGPWADMRPKPMNQEDFLCQVSEADNGFDRLEKLIRQLGSKDFVVREKSAKDLVAAGPPALI